MRKENGVYHKTFFCDELRGLSDGERILDIFLLSDIQYCSNNRGIKWLNAVLSDKTGSIHAKIWADNIKIEHESFKGQIVIVKGTVTFYSGRQALSVEMMVTAKENEYELSEIIKNLGKEKVQIYKEQILSMVKGIVSEDLRNFVLGLVNEQSIEQMAKLPVHLKGHHAYCGALLEHMSEVVTGAYCYVKSTAVVREQRIDLDMVIAGALLHDINCLYIYKQEGYVFSMDETRQYIGKGLLTYQILEETRKKYKLDDVRYHLLLHIMEASHENGEPKTLEAMVVHGQNRLSSELDLYESCCLALENAGDDKNILWSQELKREIYRIRREK